MNTNQFYLLIIIIILIIIISLFIQCNKKVLKNLEENATKDIIETYYHLGSAAPTEPGQKGYKISSISEGKYGGRSRQEVLNNIGSHTVRNYISIEEKDSYDSNLFNPNISGTEKNVIDCKINNSKNKCQNLHSSIGIGSHSIIRKLGNEVDITNNMYGGTSCPTYSNFYKHNDGNIYEVLQESSPYLDHGISVLECEPNEHHNLLNINVNIDNTIKIDEPNYYGFFYSEEVFNLLDITLINNNIINYEILFKLLNNLNSHKQGNIKDKMISKYSDYLKYSKNGKYYNISIEKGYKFVFTNCGQTGRIGPSQEKCDATYGSEFVKTEGGIQNFIVPFSGKYKITAIGANGGNSSTGWGRGYLYEGEFNLEYNDNLKILIGQKGADEKNIAGGGGGATYVLKNEQTELIISGGGGGIHPNHKITKYTPKIGNLDNETVIIENYTNAKTYTEIEVVSYIVNTYTNNKRTFYKYGITNQKYGETAIAQKRIDFVSNPCENQLAEKMGNGGKILCPNSTVGGFGGGGGGGETRSFLGPESLGGGGGGYFGGASGNSDTTGGFLLFWSTLLSFDEFTRNLVKNLQDNNIPINYKNGIGGSSYINEEEAITDTIIERVITDIDMSNYDTNGHGKVIIEYLGES
jgi:hypothetical protein